MKENAIFYFRTGGDAFSQNIESSLCIFPDSFVVLAAMCFLPNFAPVTL